MSRAAAPRRSKHRERRPCERLAWLDVAPAQLLHASVRARSLHTRVRDERVVPPGAACPQRRPQTARMAVEMLIVELPQIAPKSPRRPLAPAVSASYVLSCAEHGARVDRSRSGRQYAEAARPERKVSRSGGRKRYRLGEFFFQLDPKRRTRSPAPRAASLTSWTDCRTARATRISRKERLFRSGAS
jgi:hypothetical protein